MIRVVFAVVVGNALANLVLTYAPKNTGGVLEPKPAWHWGVNIAAGVLVWKVLGS